MSLKIGNKLLGPFNDSLPAAVGGREPQLLTPYVCLGEGSEHPWHTLAVGSSEPVNGLLRVSYEYETFASLESQSLLNPVKVLGFIDD